MQYPVKCEQSMMPTIEISETTYQGLQSLARPFVDTPDDVIRRLIEEARGTTSEPTPAVVRETGVIAVDPLNPEELTHTRVLSAAIDGETVRRPKWNGLLHLLHVRARQSLGSFEEVRKATRANIREGRFEERGFVFVPDAGMSIQGVEARLAWENTMHLVKRLGVSIEVEFEWHDKDKAAHPGARGSMEWRPEKP